MPTKWLQEQHNGSKNDTGIGFEGPGVDTSGPKEMERAFSTDLGLTPRVHTTCRIYGFPKSRGTLLQQT